MCSPFCKKTFLLKYRIGRGRRAAVRKQTIGTTSVITTERARLKAKNILLLDYKELTEQEKIWVDNYFKTAIFPILTPLAVDPAHPFPFVSNLSLNIAAIIRDPETDKQQFTRVKIPQKIMPRFIHIPKEFTQRQPPPLYCAIPIEQIIAFNLQIIIK